MDGLLRYVYCCSCITGAQEDVKKWIHEILSGSENGCAKLRYSFLETKRLRTKLLTVHTKLLCPCIIQFFVIYHRVKWNEIFRRHGKSYLKVHLNHRHDQNTKSKDFQMRHCTSLSLKRLSSQSINGRGLFCRLIRNFAVHEPKELSFGNSDFKLSLHQVSGSVRPHSLKKYYLMQTVV